MREKICYTEDAYFEIDEYIFVYVKSELFFELEISTVCRDEGIDNKVNYS